MKTIPLTRGQFAIVDDEDYKRLSKYKWYANKDKCGGWHAQRQYRQNGKVFCVLMHREIMNAPSGKNVDHIDHNRLNNRKDNLRCCTQAQNLWNQKPNKARKYKGIYRTSNGKWRVTIWANGIAYQLGCFAHEAAAAREYDKIAKLIHGEFAYLNFPEKILKKSHFE